MSVPTTAVEIAAAVKAKQVSAVEVVEHYLGAIEARESELNACNLVMADEARASARAVDASIAAGEDVGPLAGVPVALKDNMCTRGVATTCSSKILEGWQPPYDATVVTKLREAGAIAIAKTNLDEFAMGSSTENSAFGPTKNPHDITKVPGGSSGGSAVAVAAGFAPISMGSDTGGSIRQPAALCGVVGLKPTYGAVSRYGLIAFASSLDQIGPFAGNVADTVASYEVISGYDPRDTTSFAEGLPSLDGVLDGDVSGMRVGIISELLGDGIDADVKARLLAAADALTNAGAKVEETSVPACIYGLSAYYLIAPAEASSNLARFDGVRYGHRAAADNIMDMYTKTRAEGFGPEVKRRIMLGTYALSAGYYDAYYGKALKVRALIAQDFERAYQSYDVLLSPTAPTTAFGFGAKTDNPLAMYLSDVCTIPSNLCGDPAISVPFGVGGDGLPIGVQVLAPKLGERELFRVAAALEGAMS